MLNAFQFVMMALAHRQRGGAAVRGLPVRLQPAGAAAGGPGARRRRRPVGARGGATATTNSACSRPASTAWRRRCRACTRAWRPRCRRRRCAWRPSARGWRRCTRPAAFVATRHLARRAGAGLRAPGAARGAAPTPSAVRWSDESNQRYLLLASDCLPQPMVDAEQCVPAGDCFCGQRAGRRRRPASSRSARRRRDAAGPLRARRLRDRDQRAGAAARAHGRRARTCSIARRRALTDDDRALLETLASHLAGAIEEPARRRAGARGRGGRGARPAGARTARLHRAGAGVPEDPGRPAARRAAARSDAAVIERVLGELDAGVTESLSDVRELLVHFRTRTNAEDIEPGAAHHAAEVRAPDRPGHAPARSRATACRWPPTCRCRCCTWCRKRCPTCASTPGARQVWVEVQQAPQWRVRGARRRPRLRRRRRGRADQTHVGLRIMRERAQRIGADGRGGVGAGLRHLRAC